jgi:hypothetical protein
MCATEQNMATECTHETVAEQAMVGTRLLNEVRRAVQKRYRFIEVSEVYEYNVTQDDPTLGEGGLFVQYVELSKKTQGRG